MTGATRAPARPQFKDLFAPKLLTVLREGYTLQHLQQDALAGLTVAVVAIPLSMAIAIASGASPAAGLTTAIVGGFLISGSRSAVRPAPSSFWSPRPSRPTGTTAF